MLILETDNSNNEIRINAHSEIYYQFLLQPSSTHSKFIGKRQKSRTCLQTIINFKTKTSAKCIIIGASGAFRKKKKKRRQPKHAMVAQNAWEGEAYCEGFDYEVLVGTSSVSEASSNFGDELQRGFVHGEREIASV